METEVGMIYSQAKRSQGSKARLGSMYEKVTKQTLEINQTGFGL